MESKYHNTIWDNRIWFPAGYSWELLDTVKKDIWISDFSHVLHVPIWILIFYIFRKILTFSISRPLGKIFIPERKLPERSKILEKCFKTSKSTQFKTVPKNWSQTRVKRWYRRRRNQDRPDLLSKFTESFYRFTFYFGIWIFGLVSFKDKPWFKDPAECWQNYPYQELTLDVYIYFMMQLGFYGCLLVTVFSDTRRKDFYEQIAHHFLAITLIIVSYVSDAIISILNEFD